MSKYSTYSSRFANRGRYNKKPKYGSYKRTTNKQTIHPSKFVKSATETERKVYEPMYNFADFNLHDLLKQNILDRGFTAPSPIQDQAIPLGLEGRDVIGVANTGTGKTVAFALPTLNKLIDNKESRALIIAPTRELAQQIEAECKTFAKNSGLTGALLIGGSSMSTQLRDLRFKPRIVIGTPGRMKDHVERGTLDLSKFNIVVLDEVDRMVDMGFINDMRFLLGKLASKHQSFFFSATVDSKVKSLIANFAHDPVTISVVEGNTSDNVEQDVVRYNHSAEKLDKLHDLLIKEEVKKILVFDETQRRVEKLSKDLKARGFSTDAIHGGKTQGHRKRALDRFKRNDVEVLVATDVAARGIDVADVTHVINYSTPNTYDDYVHRIGRAGRAGRKGYAFTFVNS